ncbi:hypothetical protein EON63_06030 [archaeon]|nr:MAG: hypothetical protein EON63_06030 [archaeon]
MPAYIQAHTCQSFYHTIPYQATNHTLPYHHITPKHTIPHHTIQIIEWLRRTSTQYMHTINLSGNNMGGQGLYEMVAWVLSMPMAQLTSRTIPLLINFQKNKVG